MGSIEVAHADEPAQAGPLEDLISAVVTGQIAGLIMAVVVMAVFTIFLGKGPLYPVQVIGAFVFGDAALHGVHVPAILAGLLLHQLGPSLFWGFAFGLAVHYLDVRKGAALLALAVTIGLGSQLVDVNLILPPLLKGLHGHDIWAEEVPAFWSWAAHLVFGLGLVLFPWVSVKVAARLG